MSKQNEMVAAGSKAFEEGRICSPAMDAAYMAAIAGLPVGGGSAKLAKAWIRGWSLANVTALYMEVK